MYTSGCLSVRRVLTRVQTHSPEHVKYLNPNNYIGVHSSTVNRGNRSFFMPYVTRPRNTATTITRRRGIIRVWNVRVKYIYITWPANSDVFLLLTWLDTDYVCEFACSPKREIVLSYLSYSWACYFNKSYFAPIINSIVFLNWITFVHKENDEQYNDVLGRRISRIPLRNNWMCKIVKKNI